MYKTGWKIVVLEVRELFVRIFIGSLGEMSARFFCVRIDGRNVLD